MKKATIKKYTELFNSVKESGKSLSKYCKENGINYNSIKVLIHNLRSQNEENNEEVENLIRLYTQITTTNNEIVDTDDRAEVEYERNEEGRIQYYVYKIFRKNKLPITGKFSREEMATIYRLYSFYGDSLTQRVVARHFPELSSVDFKRVLRAFNITKSNAPFPIHYFEEYSEEELRAIQLREKENSFLRKTEEDVIRNNEKLLKKYAQENIDLREQLKKAQFTVDLKNISPCKIEMNSTGDKTINLYLADMHIGAAVVTGCIYDENKNYGPDEIIRRLKQILVNMSEIGPFSKINLVLLGDNIDCAGFYGKTARLDHDMPENMDPREQANQFLNITKWFVESLLTSFNAELEIFSVPCGNHAGNYEYVCNKAFMSAINALYPDIKTTLWEDYYGLFEVNSHRFLVSHGNNINNI
jgi:hypothetical protein